MAEIRFRAPEKQCWSQDIPIHVNMIRRFADAHDIYADGLSNQISLDLRAAADRLESNFGAAPIQLGETEEDRLAGMLINLCFEMEIHNQAFKDIFHNQVTQPSGDDNEAEDTATGQLPILLLIHDANSLSSTYVVGRPRIQRHADQRGTGPTIRLRRCRRTVRHNCHAQGCDRESRRIFL
jgi:hypothetical protein